jgi:predicted permease
LSCSVFAGHARTNLQTEPLFALEQDLVETRASVLIFWVLGFYPMVLLLTWAVCFYLTFIEAREQRLDAMRTLWWMLLVFFTHFIGYLALRGYVFYRRRAAV